ncbi:MATE family efflux transporter [Vulcanimicrobium alpinum]|uniref:Probable multidrug resistance protein NorM n=1 Tax=Vulcanimicrobium alpinum TaxID=3016050 RepID=A0AAN1XTB2_UNVUL|nr:MATE family efflux transporter [Vulcanimicrobium alpinum]BDE05312.1 MATE family efflux transporter [Vulcanimicrobium alpinum]
MNAPLIAAIEHRDAGAAIRRLAVPNALALLSDQLLGIVDTIAIGSLGTAALAGITGATAVFLVFGIGLFAFGSGLRIIGAQAIGAGRGDRFGTIVRSSAIAPLGIAIALALAFSVGANPLMHAILPVGAPVDASARYLALRYWCLVPMAISGQLVIAFATAGDTRPTLRLLIAINAVHIPLLLVLALGLGTHHPLGLTGAGISSLIAEFVGLGYVVYATTRRPELRVFSSWRIDAALVRQTASLSWPEFVFLTLQILPEPVTIALLAPAGAETVAAFRALSLVNDATWAIPGSLGDACEVIVGQRIGARDYAGAKAFRRESLRIGMIVCTIAGVAVAVLSWPLAAICTLNAGLATIAALPLAVQAGVTLPLKGFAMTMLAPIRASGDARFVMVMGIVTTAIAIGGIALGIVTLHLGLWAVPLGWATSWVFRDTVTALRLRNGDWERRCIPTH